MSVAMVIGGLIATGIGVGAVLLDGEKKSGKKEAPPGLPEKPIEPTELQLRARSTTKYKKKEPSVGDSFAWTMREDLIPSAMQALRNFYIVREQVDHLGIVVWELSPRKDASTPPNDLIIGQVNVWRGANYSVLMSWDMAYPANKKRMMVLLPGMIDPFGPGVDTSDDVVVTHAASPWKPFGPPISQVDDDDPPGPSGPVVPDDDIDLPDPPKSDVMKVLKSEDPWVMRQTAAALQADYPDAAEWMMLHHKSVLLKRKLQATAAGGYKYKLREGELPPYFFAEKVTGDGKRYTELLKINPGLKQTKKGVSGWDYKTTILTPVAWGDLGDMEPLPLGHGSAKPAPGGKGSPGKQTTVYGDDDPIPSVDVPGWGEVPVIGVPSLGTWDAPKNKPVDDPNEVTSGYAGPGPTWDDDVSVPPGDWDL